MLSLLAIIEATSVTGPAKNLLDFCRTASALELPVKVHVVTFDRGRAGDEFPEAVRAAGVGMTAIPERGRFDRSVLPKLKALVRELRPAILQTHAVKSHFLMANSGLWRETPWIAFHHGYTTTDFKVRLYNQLDRWSLRKPAHLVTVSEAFARQLTETGVDRTRISILQNAVSPEWVARVRKADRDAVRRGLGIAAEAPVIVAIGRMSLEKAHSDLILAFHILRQSHLGARLVLVGEGPERAALEAMAGEGVIFTGQTRDVTPYYAIADVMVLPSLTEGSPNVLLEAMACGVPSVATRVGGVPEIATDGVNALLVPAREPQKLSAAVARLLSDEGLAARIRQGGLERIAERHSVEARARTLMDIYGRVAG